MATLILEVPDSQVKMVKNVLKAIGVNVNSRQAKASKIPNEITKSAIDDARKGNVIKAESIMRFLKVFDRFVYY